MNVFILPYVQIQMLRVLKFFIFVFLFAELLEDTTEVKLMICQACRAGRKDIVDFWLGHLRDSLSFRNQLLSPHTFAGGLNPLVSACQGN